MTKATTSILPSQRFYWLLLGAASLLAIPYIAMQFSDEVNWSSFDFAVAAVLLLGTALLLELVLSLFPQRRQRLLAVGVVLLVLSVLWAELAVGVFGSPLAGS